MLPAMKSVTSTDPSSVQCTPHGLIIPINLSIYHKPPDLTNELQEKVFGFFGLSFVTNSQKDYDLL